MPKLSYAQEVAASAAVRVYTRGWGSVSTGPGPTKKGRGPHGPRP